MLSNKTNAKQDSTKKVLSLKNNPNEKCTFVKI